MSQSVSQQEPRGGDVSVNGLKLHYLDWGGDGRPIVILHATGFLGRIYRPIAEALTAIGHSTATTSAGMATASFQRLTSSNGNPR